MTLLSVTKSSFDIGSIIEAAGPPDNRWKMCDGAILEQSSYGRYVNKVPDLHPKCWGTIEEITRPSFNLKCISKMGNIIVATPATGQKVYYSSDNGDTWQESGDVLPSAGDWRFISNNGTYFVALRYGSNAAAYSSNGTSWTGFNMPVSGNWQWLDYNGSIFMAVLSGSNPVIYYSATGTSFSAGTSFGTGVYINSYPKGHDASGYVVFYDDTYCFRKTNNGTSLSTSPDAYYDGVGKGSPSIITFLNGKWWMQPWNAYPWFRTSTDGFDWSNLLWHLNQDDYDEQFYLEKPAFYSGEEYVFLDLYGNHTWVSKDGLTFSARFNSSYEMDNSIFISKEKGAIVICNSSLTYGGTTQIKRLKYTSYDYNTYFQLPHLKSNLLGVNKYIRVI